MWLYVSEPMYAAHMAISIYISLDIYINLMLLSTLWLFDINWKPLWAFDKLVAPIQSFGVERSGETKNNNKWNSNNKTSNNKLKQKQQQAKYKNNRRHRRKQRMRRWIVLTCFFLVSSTSSLSLAPCVYIPLFLAVYTPLFCSREPPSLSLLAAGRLRRWTGLFLYQNVQTLLHLLILIIIKWEARDQKAITTTRKFLWLARRLGDTLFFFFFGFLGAIY